MPRSHFEGVRPEQGLHGLGKGQEIGGPAGQVEVLEVPVDGQPGQVEEGGRRVAAGGSQSDHHVLAAGALQPAELQALLLPAQGHVEVDQVHQGLEPAAQHNKAGVGHSVHQAGTGV